MYAIFRYFTPTARKAAAAAVYQTTVLGRRAIVPVPVTPPLLLDTRAYCPLGLAMHADGADGYATTPAVAEVVRWIRFGRPAIAGIEITQDRNTIIGMAQRFVDDWDNDRITDLATAAGVTP